jgi:hypothetical protein
MRDDNACVGRTDDFPALQAQHLQQQHQTCSSVGKGERMFLPREIGKSGFEVLHGRASP